MTHKTATATRNIIVGTTTATSDLAIDGGSSPRLASVLDWDNEPVVSESVETIVGNDEEMKFVLTVVGDFVVVNSASKSAVEVRPVAVVDVSAVEAE